MQVVGPIRSALIRAHPTCMICGCSGRRPNRRLPPEQSALCCHEIANGPLRDAALDKPFAILVLCWHHNQKMHDKQTWPEARQLAVLQRRTPHNYDLEKYNELVNPAAPNRITQAEVDAWRR